MKEQRKIEIVSLQLGVDVNPDPGEISSESKRKINELVAVAVKEKAILQTNLLSETDIKKCYDMLMQAADDKKSVSGESLLATINNKTQLATLIIKLRQRIRERGDIWQLDKHRIGGITHYSIGSKL
jgi:CRISPR/Cas system CSM-associated protein Csm2 small subunit